MPTREQRDRAVVYRDAAGEHLIVAFRLYREEQYLAAGYLAGLAVECMLRSYRHMIDPVFDARHDLDKLFELARFVTIVPPARMREADAWLATVITLWSNEHRFLSEDALRRKWKRMRLDRGVKGDFVKELTRRLVNASQELVSLGAAQWKSSFGS